MCLANVCDAEGFGRIGSVGDQDFGWLVIVLSFIAIPFVPLLLAFLSFRSKNSVLNRSAWLVVLVSILFAFWGSYKDPIHTLLWLRIIPYLLALSLGLLISKAARRYSGNRFLALKLIVTALYLYALTYVFEMVLLQL